MSDIVPFSFDAPVQQQQQQKSLVDDLYGAALKSGVPHISLNNGTFFVHDASGAKVAMPDRHLDVVIVRIKQKDNRTFWVKPMKPGEPATSPDCWSNDGVAPHAPEEGRPVVTDATTALPRAVRSCAECPKNVPGSHLTGTGKACSWKKRVAVFLADDIGGQPLLLRVGSMSWTDKVDANYRGPRTLKSYVQYLVANHRNPGMLVTRITFNPNNTVATILFAPATDASGSAMGLSAEAQTIILEAARGEEVARLMEVDGEGDAVEPPSVAPPPAVTFAPTPAVMPVPTTPVAAPPAAVAPTPVAPKPVVPPAPPRPVVKPLVSPNIRSDFSTFVNVRMAQFMREFAAQWAENQAWALHEGTKEAEVVEWINDYLEPEVVGSDTPVAPPPVVAPPTPLKKPGRPPKVSAPAPTPPPPPPADDFASLLGLDTPDDV